MASTMGGETQFAKHGEHGDLTRGWFGLILLRGNPLQP